MQILMDKTASTNNIMWKVRCATIKLGCNFVKLDTKFMQGSFFKDNPGCQLTTYKHWGSTFYRMSDDALLAVNSYLTRQDNVTKHYSTYLLQQNLTVNVHKKHDTKI
jgi:hypothetical protein